MSYKLISEYVISYISKNGDSEMLKNWNEKEFKKLFKNKDKKTENSLKKNNSAYVLFSNQERENIKSEGLTLNNKQTITELARRWNEIKSSKNEEDIKIFEKFSKLAKEDKERYNNEIGKNNSKVKKNMSSYMYYCKDERQNLKTEKHMGLNNKEIVTELARRWKIFKISENKKDKQRLQNYIKLADEDRERYNSEKELNAKNTSVVNTVDVEVSVDRESNIEEQAVVETKKTSVVNSVDVEVSVDRESNIEEEQEVVETKKKKSNNKKKNKK
jgi:hypothetical protein